MISHGHKHNSHLRGDLSFTKNTQRDDQMEEFTALPFLCCPEPVFKKRLHRLQSGHLLQVIPRTDLLDLSSSGSLCS